MSGLVAHGRRALRRARLFTAVASALLCVVVACVASGCVSRVCRERLLELKESPDHRYNAALLVRRCDDKGARSVVTHVNLHAGYGGPPAEGDGSATRGEVFSIDGERRINLVWKGAGQLQVECVGCGTQQALKKESSFDDVQISYVGQ